jgi:hypothetical protein
MNDTLLWQVFCDLETREYEILGQAADDADLMAKGAFVNSRLPPRRHKTRVHSPLVAQTPLPTLHTELQATGLCESRGLLQRRLDECGWK